MKEMSDWATLPRTMFVIAVKGDGVVYEATLCNVPHALAPEVVYQRVDTSAVDAASPLRERITGAIRAFTAATVTEADDAARAILIHINNWFALAPDDGGCIRCDGVPRDPISGLCNTCIDEVTDPQEESHETRRLFRIPMSGQ